jgi:hypothetical protein
VTLGFSVFLLAVGAILAFAVHATVAGIDIHVVGLILMAAGILGLVLSILVFAPRRRRNDVAMSGIAYQAVAPVTPVTPVTPVAPVAQATVVEPNRIDQA